MNKNQQVFLIEEIWMLTFGGAFQHSGIYKPNTKEKERTKFRKKLREYIENSILVKYKTKVTDNAVHLQSIQDICNYTANYNQILKGPINIGISQKLLNLALKYYWCLGILPEPPHCPVDRIIQKKLYKQPLVNWTELDNMDTYDQIIADIKVLAEKDGLTIAQWELENFDRG